MNPWIWPALVLAFFVGVRVTAWWLQRDSSGSQKNVNQQYFQGLNYLLNEQPDKAIEVFIQALEVDSETVELHLALGGLFRRKGQLDRATRIHQNLIARPNLTEDQRLNAIYELAQDYDTAGLLDRAENLYLELKDKAAYRTYAIQGLCNIYQKEKEWQKAIDITNLYKRSERGEFSRRVSHYWCEIALLAINASSFEQAEKYLRSAINEDRTCARAVLLRGQVYFKQGKYQQAIDLWQSLGNSHDRLIEFFVVEIITSYQKLEDLDGLKSFINQLIWIPRKNKTFKVWKEALKQVYGANRVNGEIIQRVKEKSINRTSANYVLEQLNTDEMSKEQRKGLLKDFLNREINNIIEYTCSDCGFDARALHWHCPNCGEWDSIC